MESADCAVALQPNEFTNSGGVELERFLAGAFARSEVALVVALIGYGKDEHPQTVFPPGGASVSLPGMKSSVGGTLLPAGVRPKLATGVSPAERDLGLRLLNSRGDAPWWSLDLHGTTWARGDGSGQVTHEPDGELHPILVDTLGKPVVAVWTPSDGHQRWYIVPDVTDWSAVLDWLLHQALPTYVPEVLRRVRAPSFYDENLQTHAETAARQALVDMEARHAEERARLEADVQRERYEADTIRYGLLYGTGAELVSAVSAVLQLAGFATVDLDEDLGGTRSADVLVSFEGKYWLLEIKAAGGNAGEALVGDLLRHLNTWRDIRPQQVLRGGMLVVNHQHKLPPGERTQKVYVRREFVNTLTVPVISTLDLFEWWRESDWLPIQQTITGILHVPSTTDTDSPASDESRPAAETRQPPRRRLTSWWRPRR